MATDSLKVMRTRYSQPRIPFPPLIARLACAGIFSVSVSFAGTILSNTHLVTDPVQGWQVQVDVNILDNYLGDYSKSEWRYTIHNISYTPPRVLDPYIGVNGLSGFYLPFGQLPYSVTPLVTPLSGFTWCGGCIIDDFGFRTGATSGVAWYSLGCAPNNDPPCPFPWDPGPVGILVGSSIDLSILMAKPVYIADAQAHIFSTAAGYGKYFKIYDMTADIEVPGVPEPAGGFLTGGGLIVLAAGLRYVRRFVRCK